MSVFQKCGKAVLSLDISPVNGLLLCGFTDRFIRLYDPRLQGLTTSLERIVNARVMLFRGLRSPIDVRIAQSMGVQRHVVEKLGTFVRLGFLR